MNTTRVLALAAVVGSVASQAQVLFTGTDLLIDFDATLAGVNEGRFAGGGFEPGPGVPGRLDSGAWAVDGLSDGSLAFGGTGTTGDFARGTSAGGVSSGGIYAFEVGGGADVGLGFQPIASDLTPGAVTLRIQNNTGGVLGSLAVSYEIHVWNDQDRANSLDFSYSTDGVTFTPVPTLDFLSPETADASSAWAQADRQTSLLNLSVATGAHLDLRWSTDDVGGSGSRDELALDDIRLAVPVPEPSRVALVTAAILLGGVVGYRRRLRRSGRPD
jgi:hypothetical protein